jgi:histidine ammonia-lyase
MQKLQPKDYFERRSEQERTAAEQASDERAAKSHRELATHYRNLANGSAFPPADEEGRLQDGILPKEFRIVP